MTKRKPQPPRMTPYAGRRSRKFLRHDEVERLRRAAGAAGRHRHRNATLVLMMYRHGLRVSEALALGWDQIDLEAGRIHVRRLKNGKNGNHPLNRTQIEALRRLREEQGGRSPFVFASEQGNRLGRSSAYKIIARAGKRAGLDVPVNTHMLRHSCGNHLINVLERCIRRIQEYLGHRDIRHTVRYTELDEAKFDGLWDGKRKPVKRLK